MSLKLKPLDLVGLPGDTFNPLWKLTYNDSQVVVPGRDGPMTVTTDFAESQSAYNRDTDRGDSVAKYLKALSREEPDAVAQSAWRLYSKRRETRFLSNYVIVNSYKGKTWPVVYNAICHTALRRNFEKGVETVAFMNVVEPKELEHGPDQAELDELFKQFSSYLTEESFLRDAFRRVEHPYYWMDTSRPSEYLMIASILLRTVKEYPSRLKFWSELCEHGVNPDVALIVMETLRIATYDSVERGVPLMSVVVNNGGGNHDAFRQVDLQKAHIKALIRGDWKEREGFRPFSERVAFASGAGIHGWPLIAPAGNGPGLVEAMKSLFDGEIKRCELTGEILLTPCHMEYHEFWPKIARVINEFIGEL